MQRQLELVIATDLDGTFLHGKEGEKQQFYELIDQHKHKVLLVYLTGRSKADVSVLYQDNFPKADYVISGVGAEIYSGHDMQPLTAVQQAIDHLWQDSDEHVKALLADDAGLSHRPIESPNRMAYHYDPHQIQPATLDKINHAGFDYVLAYQRYLDVLPKGVNKGSSLKRLVEHLAISQQHVVTFGDSMNDHAMFDVGYKSVIVANAEEELKNLHKQNKNVYHSQTEGIHGMIEGLKYFDKFVFVENSVEIN